MENQLPARKPNRIDNYDYSQSGAYFVTICTKDKKCILSRIVGTGVLDGPKIQLSSYGIIAEKYIKQMNDHYDNISVASYVIMPNHIHLLLCINKSGNGPSGTPVPTTGELGPSGRPVPTVQNSAVSRFVSTFKRFCNKEYTENIWQSRSYDHIIRDQNDFDRHLKYIYENPFAWQKDELYIED